MLHLAFEGMEPDEIYDILMMCFLQTVDKFDSDYQLRVRRVIEIIDAQSLPWKFMVADVNRYLDWDGSRHVRLLARRKFLGTQIR